jgi:hypothetical protein
MKRHLLLLITVVLFSVVSVLAQDCDYSGTTGELQWCLKNGILTISGNGAMPDYYSYPDFEPAPWYEYKESIDTIVIEIEVTSIGDFAFNDCPNLTSITIPNSVTTIGISVFSYCTALTAITIPDGITTIGYEFFAYCTSLTSITIPSSVTTIGISAFYYCTSLTSVTILNGITTIDAGAFGECTSLPSITIPSSVTNIENSAFYSCTSLTSIGVEDENNTYASDNGALLNKDKTILICCPGGKSGAYVTPNGVITIANWAFSGCINLTSITIPNSVTTIGGIFTSCTILTSINVENENNNYASENGVLFNKSKTTLICYPIGKTADTYLIPGSVTTIENYAFARTTLTSINIPNSVTTIGNNAFDCCFSLTSITIPSSVITIGNCAFAWTTALTSISIPNSVTTIGYCTFRGCTALTSIIISSSVIMIEGSAISYCTNLTSITNLNPTPVEINPDVFEGVEQSGCTLVVPTSAIFTYENAEVWQEFNIVGGGILVNPISSNNEQGYVIGNGLYDGGGKSTATVTAVAYTGYKFVNWEVNGEVVSTDNPYSFTVTEDIELIANFEEGVGIVETVLPNINVYPNPTTGELKIESELRIENVVIYDVFGKIQKTENWKAENVIDISHLPAGAYFVKIYTGAGEVTKKVLKE